jgi:hypothetical protein
MKKILLTISLVLATNLLYAQTMVDLLKLLPKESLKEIDVDSLIKNGTYYPPDNDELQKIKYSLGKSNEDKGTLRIEMFYETGQRGFEIRELKRVRSGKNEWLVIYSSMGGFPINFWQGDLETFHWKKGKLIRTKEKMLPVDIGLKDFIKPGAPDSVMNIYNSYASHCYELIHYGDNVKYVLHENFDSYKIDKSWLLGNVIEFRVENGRFKRQNPTFE